MKKPIIIDTDPGIDDAVAIALALYDESLDVRLITTVCGNVSIEHTTNNALKLVTFLNKETKVAQGAHTPLVEKLVDASNVHGSSGMDGFDFPTPNMNLLQDLHAVDAMYEVIMQAEENVTIVAIGPLTNVANLLNKYPSVKERIAQIVLMGGALGRGNRGVLSEFNIATDPEAAHVVFESGLDLVVCPLEVGLKALVYPQDSAYIETLNKTGKMFYSLFKKYRGGSFDKGLKMYDATAIGYLLNPSMYQIEDVYVGVELTGTYTKGATVVDLKNYLGKKANAKVCVDIDPDKFKSWFLSAIKKCY